MDLGLQGKRAIVTGGSKGIGRRVVDLLVAEGCDVGFCARNEADVVDALAVLSKGAARVVGGVADVTDDVVFRGWMKEAIAALGGLDILRCECKLTCCRRRRGGVAEGLDVDILGTVRAVEEAQPDLEASECGSIVSVSSTAAVNISGGIRAYSGVKAALISYMSGISTNLAGKGIRANTVSPGAVCTGGGVGIETRRRTRRGTKWRKSAIQWADLHAGRSCGSVVFLASPAASYISGVNLVIDGAATTRIQF